MQSDGNPYREEIVATIVHELRSPLAALSNELELCRADASSQTLNAARQRMERQLRKALRLVDDLLDVSRLRRVARFSDGEPVDFSDVIRRAVEDLDHKVRACQQVLALEMPADAVWIRGDKIRLEQVVANLIDNSSKYSTPGGHITVNLWSDSDHAVLRVRDNGVGIQPEDLPHIFDPFFRGKAPRNESQNGLGLGLALVRRLVELHSGTIEARSRGHNCGSEFLICLPVNNP
jgi:signal transduction histidine kinase